MNVSAIGVAPAELAWSQCSSQQIQELDYINVSARLEYWRRNGDRIVQLFVSICSVLSVRISCVDAEHMIAYCACSPQSVYHYCAEHNATAHLVPDHCRSSGSFSIVVQWGTRLHVEHRYITNLRVFQQFDSLPM